MNFHRNHWLLFSIVFFGFIFLAIIIAIAPAYWTQAQVEVNYTGETLSDHERQGLAVYISEGCVSCHTQQVRPLDMDSNFGRASAPEDYARIGGPLSVWQPYTPAVLGSARIGPDLSDVGTRQPAETWQYLHLYNPRTVVEDSIMPAYPWLFDVTDSPADDATVVPVSGRFAPGGDLKVVPNERGEALVAYLLALKQPLDRQPAARAKDDDGASDDDGVDSGEPAWAARGESLYANNCAACHQASGQGVPGAFPPLVDDPVVVADDPTEHIEIVLFGAHGREINGETYGSPMPPFEHFSDEEIAAMINHERTSWGNDAPTVTPDDVARVREEGEQ